MRIFGVMKPTDDDPKHLKRGQRITHSKCGCPQGLVGSNPAPPKGQCQSNCGLVFFFCAQKFQAKNPHLHCSSQHGLTSRGHTNTIEINGTTVARLRLLQHEKTEQDVET